MNSETIGPLRRFTGENLTATLAGLETAVRGGSLEDIPNLLVGAGADGAALTAAAELKRLAGQINVTIHALGILRCLPHILEPGERVEYVSLGAGNTGRPFDLETNVRVAEFKFIHWRGGAETIRQNGVFKDYFQLAEHPTAKQKYLYLFGTDHALKFLKGGRAMSSVLSRGEKLQQVFRDRFGNSFPTVGSYYAVHSEAVRVVDVSPWLGELV